jgi:hypothetical protein
VTLTHTDGSRRRPPHLLRRMRRTAAVTAAAIVIAAGAPGVVDGSPEPEPLPSVPTCFGRPATIVGTDGDDVIVGTPGDDVFVALGGKDIVLGLGGNDRICGGDGDDILIGGAGRDRLSGGPGEDILIGGDGWDVCRGGVHHVSCEVIDRRLAVPAQPTLEMTPSEPTTTTTTVPPTTTNTTPVATTPATTSSSPPSTEPATTPAPTEPATTPAPTAPATESFAATASNVDVNAHLVSPGWGTSAGYPAFRFFCEHSHFNYDDPIVHPGQPGAAHLHQYFGNRSANAFSTWTSLRSTGDSTCQGGPINRTAYWFPAVLDAQGRAVVADFYQIYYKAENAPLVNGVRHVEAWPNGLRMLAGSRMDGQPVDPSAQRRDGAGLTWGWRCESNTGSAAVGVIPNCAAGDTLIGWVRFPYCWDGVNRDSADHRSHLRYGTGNTWGVCPAGFRHIPEVTEFLHIKVPAGGSGGWRLSSDDMGSHQMTPGTSLHADWLGAWDPVVQTRWLDCLRQNRDASGGALCDGQQLRSASDHTGPATVSVPPR